MCLNDYTHSSSDINETHNVEILHGSGKIKCVMDWMPVGVSVGFLTKQ